MIRVLGVIYEMWIRLSLLLFICIRLCLMTKACDSCSTPITYVSSCIMHHDSCTMHHDLVRIKLRQFTCFYVHVYGHQNGSWLLFGLLLGSVFRFRISRSNLSASRQVSSFRKFGFLRNTPY